MLLSSFLFLCYFVCCVPCFYRYFPSVFFCFLHSVSSSSECCFGFCVSSSISSVLSLLQLLVSLLPTLTLATTMNQLTNQPTNLLPLRSSHFELWWCRFCSMFVFRHSLLLSVFLTFHFAAHFNTQTRWLIPKKKNEKTVDLALCIAFFLAQLYWASEHSWAL